MSRFEKRIAKLRNEMSTKGIDAFFLPPTGEFEYITGIRRQRPNPTQSNMPGDWFYGAILTEDHILISVPKMASGFVEDQIKKHELSFIDEVVVIPENEDHQEFAKKIIQRFNLDNDCLAVPNWGMAETLIKLWDMFPGMKFKSASAIIENMRMIKDSEEIAKMRKTAELTDNVFYAVLEKLKPEMTEEEIAAEVDWQILQQGGEGVSFITGIMCQGGSKKNGYKEDVGRSGKSRIEAGQTLAFDFGMVYDGYVSDFGRTVYIDQPDSLVEKIHHLVMNSQEEAIKAMKDGKITAGETDGVARSVIEEAGYGENFFHRLGHGIGIDVHEPPYLTAADKTLLKSGMTFTVEPSINLPGKAWSRVEDVVLVTDNGGDCLNKASKEIIVI